MAVENDIIQRRGAWYSYGEQKWNGTSNIELTEDQVDEIYKELVR